LTLSSPDAGRRPIAKVVAASLIGTTIEWYDFFLYGSAAALVFNKLFFTGADPLTGTLLSFATYAIGFLARPLGGLVFGHFGDRVGRKKLLVFSLLLMGGSTAAMGLLPTYAAVGAAAPLLLTLLRLIQAEDEVRGELLTDLLTAPDRNPGALLARAGRLGVDLAEPHVVLVAHAETVSRSRLAMAAARHAALAGSHADEVVLLVRGDDPSALAPRLAADLRSVVDSPVTVGSAGPAGGPSAIADAHAEAVRCLRALLALGRVGEGASAVGLGFLGVLLGDRADLDGFVRAALGPVLDYDARRGTELVRTLDAYFAVVACPGDPAGAAPAPAASVSVPLPVQTLRLLGFSSRAPRRDRGSPGSARASAPATAGRRPRKRLDRWPRCCGT
jgi:hypothetical protein